MTSNLCNLPQFQRPDPLIGTPEQDSIWWPGQQSYADTCAIRCQEFILEQFYGLEIAEDALVQEAMQYGWYTGGGTAMLDVGNLLELHGIPVQRYTNANVFHLANELAQGHKVIIGVDSGELWHRNFVLEQINNSLGIKDADHAVVVSGIDTTDPNDVRVIISDPGTGEVAAAYPLEQFIDAWQDSDFFMVATATPAPQWLPEMVNFDYSLGHLPTVMGMPYPQFVTYATQPEEWEQWFDQQMKSDEEIAEPTPAPWAESSAMVDCQVDWQAGHQDQIGWNGDHGSSTWSEYDAEAEQGYGFVD